MTITSILAAPSRSTVRNANAFGYNERGVLVTNFYDAKSRRVKKVTPEATTTFFYDDWNLIEERIAYTNGTCSAIRYYWGKDLSGTLQGAGGVGGLLYLTIDDLPYVPCYDNNGNIVRYLDENGNIVAQYIYDAFGKLIAQSGSLADFFRHCFSTKYFDSETRLYYYGYRFYSPALMRWLNRDPIVENGGLNLYAFCSNNPVALFDDKGERISIKEDNSIVKDQIATQARAAFFPNASVSFSCSWKGVLSITGTASRRIEILTPGLPQWNQRFRRYDKKWGSKRTAATEWIATYAHEMDHWNAFNSFFGFLHLLNEFDGIRLCNKCDEMKNELERQYYRMWSNAFSHSLRYDLKDYKYGGAYPNAKK